MIYYRTHASRTNDLPSELRGWSSPSADASLVDNVVGEHRVLGVVPQFVFAPPTVWHPLENGWEVGVVGETNISHHANVSSPFLVVPMEIDGRTWILPTILTANGARAFKVKYGGEGFEPIFTEQQKTMLAIATEARNAVDVEMPIRAKWAATLLTSVYALSVKTISIIGLPEEVINRTLSIAGGTHAGLGE